MCDTDSEPNSSLANLHSSHVNLNENGMHFATRISRPSAVAELVASWALQLAVSPSLPLLHSSLDGKCVYLEQPPVHESAPVVSLLQRVPAMRHPFLLHRSQRRRYCQRHRQRWWRASAHYVRRRFAEVMQAAETLAVSMPTVELATQRTRQRPRRLSALRQMRQHPLASTHPCQPSRSVSRLSLWNCQWIIRCSASDESLLCSFARPQRGPPNA